MTNTLSKNEKTNELNDLVQFMTAKYGAIVVHHKQNAFAKVKEHCERTK